MPRLLNLRWWMVSISGIFVEAQARSLTARLEVRHPGLPIVREPVGRHRDAQRRRRFGLLHLRMVHTCTLRASGLTHRQQLGL